MPDREPDKQHSCDYQGERVRNIGRQRKRTTISIGLRVGRSTICGGTAAVGTGRQAKRVNVRHLARAGSGGRNGSAPTRLGAGEGDRPQILYLPGNVIVSIGAISQVSTLDRPAHASCRCQSEGC